ncbi:probable UDP-arabinose 4-epimerase 1 [Brachypodium distachyon]|nr:probable UDP-arabinose 4-epimerase 1 [Brachypodium distachyon]|eukprot:XP_024310340.1 probable UDP-arabinose 4-epimerase 1 [Brachypodium distachyon]
MHNTNSFSIHEPGVRHVLATGGAGYIGSHPALWLLKDSFRHSPLWLVLCSQLCVVDNLSRGNIGAVKVLQSLIPESRRLQFIYADLWDPKAVNKIFAENAFDAVMHLAVVAYVGESMLEPLRYQRFACQSVLFIKDAMATHNVRTLIYSSTCATYGEPKKMPISEETPQVYATIKTGSMSITVSTLDSLLDLMAGGILWFTHLSMKKVNIYKYPIGKLRVQPVGIIVFASIMATLGFQVLVQAIEQLVENKPGNKIISYAFSMVAL